MNIYAFDLSGSHPTMRFLYVQPLNQEGASWWGSQDNFSPLAQIYEVFPQGLDGEGVQPETLASVTPVSFRRSGVEPGEQAPILSFGKVILTDGERGNHPQPLDRSLPTWGDVYLVQTLAISEELPIFNVLDFGATPNDGTDDTQAIQAALDMAVLQEGARVYVPAGTYLLSGTGDASDGAIRIGSHTEIYGDGMGVTELKIVDGYSKKITGIIRTPVNQVTENVVIRDLSLNGNNTGEIDGIMTGVLPGSGEFDNNLLIERVEIYHVTRIAFNPHEQTRNLTIRDSIAHHNGWDGFIADFVSNAVYENNIAYSNGRHGFNVVTHSHDMILRNNLAYDNVEGGIVLQRGNGSPDSPDVNNYATSVNYNILVENNEVYGNGKEGILLKMTNDSQVVNNRIYDNGGDGVKFEGAANNIVANNLIENNGGAGVLAANYSGSITGPRESYGNRILDNVITGSSNALKESGSSTRDNLYAGNTLSGQVSLNASSELLPISEGITFDLLTDTRTSSPEEIFVYSGPGATEEEVPAPPAADLEAYLQSLDRIEGSEGGDRLLGSELAELFLGKAGGDLIQGGLGDDVLVGGLGLDWLEGGDGQDLFALLSLQDIGDSILDFQGDADHIYLAPLLPENLSLTAEEAFVQGYLALRQVGDDVWVLGDRDGNAGPAKPITLVTLIQAEVQDIEPTAFILEAGFPQESLPQEILFVAGSSTLGEADQMLVDQLGVANYQVTVMDDDVVSHNDAAGKALVLLSKSVSSSVIGDEFTTVDVPVMTWKSELYDDLGMTGTQADLDFGQQSNQTALDIIDPTHPLAANLSGTVSVYGEAKKMIWGAPGEDAIQVASVRGQVTRSTIFAYEADALLVNGSPAPEKRIGFFLDSTSNLTTEALALFDGAVAWAIA